MSLFVNEAPILGDNTVVRSIALGTDVKLQVEEFITIPGLVAASTSLDVLICPKNEQIQITGIEATFGTASSSGTLDLVKMQGTTAVAAGTTMLTGTISLAGAANTPVFGTLSSTVSAIQLSNNGTLQDRLGIKLGGTLTSLVNCLVQIRFRRIQ